MYTVIHQHPYHPPLVIHETEDMTEAMDEGEKYLRQLFIFKDEEAVVTVWERTGRQRRKRLVGFIVNDRDGVTARQEQESLKSIK